MPGPQECRELYVHKPASGVSSAIPVRGRRSTAAPVEIMERSVTHVQKRREDCMYMGLEETLSEL